MGTDREQASWVIVVISSCLLVTLVTTCKCKMKHPQQSFCTADFVIMGKVKNITISYGEPQMTMYGQTVKDVTSRTYKVKILRKFKLDKGKKKKLKKLELIRSPGSPHECAMIMRKGIKYVITGTVRDGVLWTDSCCWVQNYRQLTSNQKIGLKKQYRKNCLCQVNCCAGQQCNKGENLICQMKTAFWSCYNRYGTCIYRKKAGVNKCYWRKSKHLTKCSTIGK